MNEELQKLKAYLAPLAAVATERLRPMIDAVIAECREETVRECEDRFCREWGSLENESGVRTGFTRLRRAILAVAKPPVPVWEHKPDCPTPYQWSGQHWECDRIECCQRVDAIIANDEARYCDGCGAPKPEGE